MSIFKNRAIEILWLYQKGSHPLAIAREPEPKPITMGEAFRGFDLNVYKQEKFE